MTKEEFETRLIGATHAAADFAGEFVCQKLPRLFRYRAHLNQSCDLHGASDEVLYPTEDGIEIDLPFPAAAAALLWRAGRIPQWIDIAAWKTPCDCTLFRLLCCGRFTANSDRLYYRDGGLAPFGIKSPDLPTGWQRGVKFDLPAVRA